ncbi:MAG: DUF4328 domain-containing protein, partial [Actinobacteria bacterium]|nr:DUF4328 domain-containing protein [Actinomycetota bacterium]
RRGQAALPAGLGDRLLVRPDPEPLPPQADRRRHLARQRPGPAQAASGSWREGSVPALFNWWWLAFVVSSFADQASWRGSVGAESISELQLSAVLFLIADVASLVSGILAVKVISRTTARQEARAARVLGSPG